MSALREPVRSTPPGRTPPPTSARDAGMRAAAVARVRGGEKPSVVAADIGVHPSKIWQWIKAAEVEEQQIGFAAALPAVDAPTPDAPPVEVAVRVEAVPPEPTAPEPTVTEPATLVAALPEATATESTAPEPATLVAALPEATAPEPAAPAPTVPEATAPEPAAPAPTVSEPVAPTMGDAIIGFTDRIPIVGRYVLVTVGWLVCLFVAWVVPGGIPGRPVLVAAHLLAMVVSFGAVVTLDWHGILWQARHRAVDESIRLSHALSPLIWGGLVVLLVSGALLKPDLTNPLAWLKLGSVLLVVLNGVSTAGLREHLRKATSDGLRSLDPGPRRKIVLASVVSQLCWLTAILVGLTTTLSR